MSPAEANGYYDPTKNGICTFEKLSLLRKALVWLAEITISVFLAALLQPYFELDLPRYAFSAVVHVDTLCLPETPPKIMFYFF